MLRNFEAEGTDAHRLCTIGSGWAERFGRDILISFKNALARERLNLELNLWGRAAGFTFGRIFIRFLPQKNEERDESDSSSDTGYGASLDYGNQASECRDNDRKQSQ